MASILFANGTIIPASWLNDVNASTYISPKTNVFSATAGQTAFTLTNAPSTLMLTQVFINGLRLSPTTDYGVVGTTLTLTSGATLADELIVEYFA